MPSLHTAEEKAKALALYKTLSIKALRHRQRLCDAQLALCGKHDDVALQNLQSMRDLLTEAVDYISFKDA